MESTVQSEPAEREVARRTIGIEVVGEGLRPIASEGARLAVVTRPPGESPKVHTTDLTYPHLGGLPNLLFGELIDDCNLRAEQGEEVLPPGLDVIEALWGQPVTGAGRVAELEEVVAKARREIESLARRLAVRFQETEEARAEVATLTDQLGDMRASVSAAEAEVDRLTAVAGSPSPGPAAAYTAGVWLHPDQITPPPEGPRWQVRDARDEVSWHDITEVAPCGAVAHDIENCVVLISSAWADGYAHIDVDGTVEVRIPASVTA